MLKNIEIWLGEYIRKLFRNKEEKYGKNNIFHILFCICDHFEPYWNNTDDNVAYNRVKMWVDFYQKIASKHRDSINNYPQYAFFYPIEEYKSNLLKMIEEICRNGFGETEIHLHHDRDNSNNLRKNLNEFKKILHEEHGLLSKNKFSSDIHYGFIHGNWALDNSRPDGKWCGVNDELTILKDTGCYADFTMPSAPSDTQTKTINSIYYAVDDPNSPKSHNEGKAAQAGFKNNNGLLCIQGPLSFNLKSRKFGVIPRIENGCLSHESLPSITRLKIWENQHIHVCGRPDIVFIKLYTHGTQEKTSKLFFEDGALDRLFSMLENSFNNVNQYKLYYVSPRKMYNVVKGLEANKSAELNSLWDFELVKEF